MQVLSEHEHKDLRPIYTAINPDQAIPALEQIAATPPELLLRRSRGQPQNACTATSFWSGSDGT